MGINEETGDKNEVLVKMEAIFKKYSKDVKLIGIGMGETMRAFSAILSNGYTYVASSNQTTLLLTNRITADLQSLQSIDLYFDSADFYDTLGNLIKGGGGGLTKEKLLLKMARRSVIIVDKSKKKRSFHSLYVPVEILKESYSYFMNILAGYKLKGRLRLVKGISPFITDNSNFIVDVEFNLEFLKVCKTITGVIEHGYFDNELRILIEEL